MSPALQGWGGGGGAQAHHSEGLVFSADLVLLAGAWLVPFTFKGGGVKVSHRSARSSGKAKQGTMKSDFPTSAGRASLRG